MTDPNARLHFMGAAAYAWKMDQRARLLDAIRADDEADLLRYAATDPGGMYHVRLTDALTDVSDRRAVFVTLTREDAA